MGTTEVTSGQNPESGRLVAIDGLRALSFVLIVTGHSIAVLAGLAHEPWEMAVHGVILALTRFALPAFMVISSILVARQIKRRSYHMKFSRLAVPYAVWTLVYLLVGRVAAGGQGVPVADQARNFFSALLTGTGYYHLWYVLIALQIAIAAPLAAMLMSRLGSVARWLFTLGVVLTNMVLLGQVWGPISDRFPFMLFLFGASSDRNLLFWCSYLVLGVAIGLDYDAFMSILKKHRLWLRFLYAVAAASVGVIAFRHAIAVGGDYGSTSDISRVMQPWILPFEILSIFVWLSASESFMRGRAGELASSISAASFGGYLAHPIVILLVIQVVFQNFANINATLMVAILAGSGLIGSILITRMFAAVSMPVSFALTGAVSESPQER